MTAPQESQTVGRRFSSSKTLKIIALTWLTMLGFDFLLHGALLAGLYARPSSFLLPPERAFLLIPLGYLSFFMLAVTLVWLLQETNRTGAGAGLGFGLKLGGLLWGSLILGLASISTADRDLLLGWFIGQTLELGLAGAIAGQALEHARLKGLFGKVGIFIGVMIVLTVILQSVGLAPAIKMP